MIEIVANGLAALTSINYANAVIDAWFYGQGAFVGGLVVGVVLWGLR